MFLYKLNFIPTSFVIIGAGGTGGRLVPLLAQFIKTIAWIQNPRIFLIDHDIVEEKNLIRQNFIRPDINRPKAVVLAERYSKAFDITIIPVVKQVGKETLTLSEVTHAELGLVKTSLSNLTNAVIILCVDSAEARRAILNNLLTTNNSKNLLVIDSGNENDFGQVQIYNPEYYVTNWGKEDVKTLAIPNMLGLPFDTDMPTIPFPKDFYEKMEDGVSRSCAELDQTLAINALMATSIMGVIQNLIYHKPISFSKLNVSLSFGSIPELMSVDYLHTRCKELRGGRVHMPVHARDADTVFAKIRARIIKDFSHLLDDESKLKPAKSKKVKKLPTDESKEQRTINDDAL